MEFFVCGSLRDLIPDDHVLARVDQVLDLDWLHEDVAEVYAPGISRPAFDPEAAARLMLAVFRLGIDPAPEKWTGSGRHALHVGR